MQTGCIVAVPIDFVIGLFLFVLGLENIWLRVRPAQCQFQSGLASGRGIGVQCRLVLRLCQSGSASGSRIEVQFWPVSRLGAGLGFSVSRVWSLTAVSGLVLLMVSDGTLASALGLSRISVLIVLLSIEVRISFWGSMLYGLDLIGCAQRCDSAPLASPCLALWISVVGLSVARSWGSASFSASWFGSVS